MDAAPRHHQIRRQVGVHSVRDLIDVVADAPQLREQRGVHHLVGRALVQIDFAFQHQPFAQTRGGQTKLTCLCDLEGIVIFGHADADHFSAGTFLVRPSLWHVLPHQVGFGRAE